MCPVVDDLRDDVGGEARAAVQDVRERRAMLSLVRANTTGLKYRFKVITPVRIPFIDRRPRRRQPKRAPGELSAIGRRRLRSSPPPPR